MKNTNLFVIGLATLSLLFAGCNQTNGGTPSPQPGPGPEPGTYTPTELENQIIAFLEVRGVTGLEKIEPLHSIKDSDVDSIDKEEDFYQGTDGNTYSPYFEARVSTQDIVNDLLDAFEEYNWTVPEYPTYYGYECLNAEQTVEIDVASDTDGTWIDVYAYADLGGGDFDYIDIGDATSITFSDEQWGLENSVQYNYFFGEKITIIFGEGENDGKYYSSGSAIRIYGNGYVYVCASEEDVEIQSITYTWGSGKPETADVADVGTYDVSTGVWTGPSSEVTLTRPTGSGHWRLQSISVTLAA